MSLRAFHVVFISLAGVLCAYFAGWSWTYWRAGHAEGRWLVGVAALSFVLLAVYLRWFLKSWRKPG